MSNLYQKQDVNAAQFQKHFAALIGETTQEGRILAELASLREQVKSLVEILSPPSSVILTGSDVKSFYDQLRAQS